jgi:hypothetical protein
MFEWVKAGEPDRYLIENGVTCVVILGELVLQQMASWILPKKRVCNSRFLNSRRKKSMKLTVSVGS